MSVCVFAAIVAVVDVTELLKIAGRADSAGIIGGTRNTGVFLTAYGMIFTGGKMLGLVKVFTGKYICAA